jgi:hypothetical protein
MLMQPISKKQPLVFHKICTHKTANNLKRVGLRVHHQMMIEPTINILRSNIATFYVKFCATIVQLQKLIRKFP